ncbi:MAG TPA: IPT/TIG domain-containing protein [Gammaproteobacteria bacterium]
MSQQRRKRDGMGMACFLLASGFLLLSPGAVAGGAPKLHDTTTTVACTPNPVALNSASTCTVTVTDLGGQGPNTSPAGDVTFSTDGTGNFSATSCSLVPGLNATSSCSVNYTPTVFGTGTHTISAAYSGGADPNPATGIVFNPSAGNTGLAISYPVLAITSISPNAGNRGGTVNVTVSGTNFVAGATTLTLGANITVSALTVTSSTQLTATLTIADAAVTGLRDVTVTNPAPGGGSDTLVNGFDVRNPLPVIDTLTPAAVEVGSGSIVVTIDGSGFVSDSIARFNGSARTTTFVNSTRLQMTLLAGDTGTIGTYPVTVFNAAPGGGTSNVEIFSVVASGGSFDTVEPAGALGSTLFTKLAGAGFGIDILATEVSRLAMEPSFTGTVKIELLDAGDDSAGLDAAGCRASWSVVQTLPSATFAAADNGRININTSYADALRIARFRISYPATGTPTHVGCSSDAFSIRPTALAVSTSLNNTGTTGLPIHAAGTAFTMTATAIPGYDGTPVIDTGAITVGVLGGSFAAASPASGVSTGNAFTYTEVGNFTLPAGDIYDDTFTAVDQPGDCIAGSSNTLSGGKYGCAFGTLADLVVGRFVPAYFDVEVTDGCADAGGFTYSRQPFTVRVTAREAGGGRTQNYAGAFARAVTLSDAGDTSRFMGTTHVIPAADFSAGIADNPATAYAFASAETPFTLITLRATDPDGASSAGHLEESTQIRSGRLVIDQATAITTNDGLLGVTLQAWQDPGTGTFEWAVHTDDISCTAPIQSEFSLDPASFSGNLASGETAITGFFFNAGLGALTLSAPGSGNDGSVDILVTTDSWLEFDWNTTGTPVPPRGTMTFFEIFQSEDGFIERHEVLP